MTSDTTLQAILNNTYTKSDFYRRIGLVQECLEYALYEGHEQSAGNTAMHCATYAREAEGKKMAQYISEWGTSVFSDLINGNPYSRLKELKEELERLPELVLYVPVAMEDEDKVTIGEWGRKHLNTSVMLKFIVDPDAVGGCMFVWKGEYHDFSLRYFMRKRGEQVSELIQTHGSDE